jgi:RNA polymerase sigma-70 factor, ECF subfamily
MTEPEIQQRHEQPYVGIRSEVPPSGIRGVVDRAFPQLFSWLGERGIQPSGPPFIRYHELDGAGGPIDIESAAPVSDAGAAPAAGPVHAGVLPAGRYVTLLHVGPYTHDTVPDLRDAQAALKDWTEEQGIVWSRPSERGEALPCCVEHYRIGPPMEADWTKWETELAYLIVEG